MVTVYSKAECSLCDVATDVIQGVLATLPPPAAHVRLEHVDIEDPAQDTWRRAYRYDIPVIHLDGKPIMKHRVDAERLRALLLARTPP